jgi:DNA-binding transcriptional ArsR family regulator
MGGTLYAIRSEKFKFQILWNVVSALSDLFRARTYLTHFPVQSYLEADVLSKESTWNILEYARRAGARGVTAEELSKTLDLPASVVYSTLKELRRLGFVFIHPREKGKSKDRKKRYVCDKSTWGKYGVDNDFLSAMTFAGITDHVVEALRPSLVGMLSKSFDEFKAKKELKAFLPQASPDNICSKCGRSHEAMEFIYAIVLRAIDKFITESDEFRVFLVERGYSK